MWRGRTAGIDPKRTGQLYSLSLCIEYKLPNSMARPEGFNLSVHLSEVQAQRIELADQFSGAAGISFLQSRVAQRGEALDVQCAKELLAAASSVGG